MPWTPSQTYFSSSAAVLSSARSRQISGASHMNSSSPSSPARAARSPDHELLCRWISLGMRTREARLYLISEHMSPSQAAWLGVTRCFMSITALRRMQWAMQGRIPTDCRGQLFVAPRSGCHLHATRSCLVHTRARSPTNLRNGADMVAQSPLACSTRPVTVVGRGGQTSGKPSRSLRNSTRSRQRWSRCGFSVA